MINDSAFVGLAGRLGASFQLLSSSIPPTPFPIFVGRQASLIGVSQEGQNEEAMEQV